MLIGIIVAIAAIVVLSVAAIILYVAVSKREKKKSAHAKPKVDTMETVGVAPEDPLNPDVRLGADNEEEVDPYKHLRRRFRAIGVFVGLAFAVLGAKIFSLQVLGKENYEKLSTANATTSVKTPAPRGNIFDAKGRVLVKNRSSLTVLAEGDVASDHDILARLSVVLGLPINVVKNRIMDQSNGAQSQRVVASDVTKKQAAYISEHGPAFTGVSIQSRTVREYPYGALAAHVLGYTGTVDEQELAEPHEGRFIESGDIVGKQGVEASYDNMLAGDHGERVVVSDADGNIVSIKSEIQPSKGSDVYLTIDAAVQYHADSILASTIAPNGVIGTSKGSAGSVVVVDVEDGSVIALSNYPTFKPSILTNGISQDTWNLYNTESSHFPLLNRAIAGTYPAASTFKAFTGIAGLKYGYASSNATYTCKGSWDGWNSGNVQNCWDNQGHGTLGFRKGIVESCDVVFYEIGKKFFDNKASVGETAMQDEILKFNFGKLTGIDIDGEESGRVPTPKWKAEYFKDVPTESFWVGGDTTNMAIGQGYVLITPIQLAVAYASLATGKLMVPHLLKEVKNDNGDVVAKKQPEVLGIPDVDPAHLRIIRDALHGVGTENTSVSAIMKAANLDAAIKTGTAEVAGKNDFSWTAAYAPYDNPKYAVACIIEEGGGGSAAATPVAASVLKAALDARDNKLNDVAFIPGSTGKSVKISATKGRTD